jgi:hypothetical protein
MSAMKASMIKGGNFRVSWLPASRGSYIWGVPPCAWGNSWSQYSRWAVERVDWTSVGIGRNGRRRGVVSSRLSFICFF